jgi:hypothetical protein
LPDPLRHSASSVPSTWRCPPERSTSACRS